MAETVQAIGLMSGTSMDGVDVALIETDGEAVVRPGPSGFRPYASDEREAIRAALAAATTLTDRDARPPALAAAEAVVTTAHVEAVRAFLADNAIDAAGVAVVGFHGQTVFHAPERRLTVQIGDGAALSEALAIPVVFDLRADDVAAGGQGAPLVPVYHRALAAALPRPVAILNVGGVANLTLIAADGGLVAFDTGPGNALIDDLMGTRTGARMDEGGRTAAAGTVDEAALSVLLDNPYFARPVPKSLDRNAFSAAPVAHLSTADAAATLVAFTAETVARGLKLAGGAGRIVVCGGGARNPVLMAALAARTGVMVDSADALGWSADAIEAQAFAYLAVRSRRGLPITFPGTTGVARPLTGGRLAQPRRRAA
jgi:anhydro-N-acetylmuramic acid kinase